MELYTAVEKYKEHLINGIAMEREDIQELRTDIMKISEKVLKNNLELYRYLEDK